MPAQCNQAWSMRGGIQGGGWHHLRRKLRAADIAEEAGAPYQR